VLGHEQVGNVEHSSLREALARQAGVYGDVLADVLVIRGVHRFQIVSSHEKYVRMTGANKVLGASGDEGNGTVERFVAIEYSEVHLMQKL
jgi:hypothetical protein